MAAENSVVLDGLDFVMIMGGIADDLLYVRSQVFETVIRHAATLSVRSIAITMVESTFAALLMTPTSLALRPCPSLSGTSGRAVAMSPIAPRAQEEDLQADPTADAA